MTTTAHHHHHNHHQHTQLACAQTFLKIFVNSLVVRRERSRLKVIYVSLCDGRPNFYHRTSYRAFMRSAFQPSSHMCVALLGYGCWRTSLPPQFGVWCKSFAHDGVSAMRPSFTLEHCGFVVVLRFVLLLECIVISKSHSIHNQQRQQQHEILWAMSQRSPDQQ